MKRTLILFLILCLLLGCAACTQPAENTCTFYYLRPLENIQYGQPDALVAPVVREIANEELEYLFQLYLDGPQDDNYVTPIPTGTHLESLYWEENTLVLVLSEEFSGLEGIQLTLAGACLAATCHALADARDIQVRSGEEIYDFNLNNFTFLDNSVGA